MKDLKIFTENIEQEALSSIYNPVSEMTSSLVKKYDEMCWNAFIECGYSKEWLMENKDRVYAVRAVGNEYGVNSNSITVIVDGKEIFTAHFDVKVDLEGSTMRANMHVAYG